MKKKKLSMNLKLKKKMKKLKQKMKEEKLEKLKKLELFAMQGKFLSEKPKQIKIIISIITLIMTI